MNQQILSSAAGSLRLFNHENISFLLKNNLLYANIDGTEQRVSLRLAFPYDTDRGYISVLNSYSEELGLIRDCADLSKEDSDLVACELNRRYYTPIITAIYSMKERRGYAYWEVETEAGPVQFTVRDNFKNIIRIGDNSAIICDIDGNRFKIPSLFALDKKSRRKIELYL